MAAAKDYKILITAKDKAYDGLENYTFKSNDENIATVSEDGVLTSTGAGTTTITVKSKKGYHHNELVVNVGELNVTTLESNNVVLKEDETKKIQTVVNKDKRNTTSLTYKSKDEKVAKVDKEGKITAVKDGKTEVEIKTKDGIETVIEVEVKKEIIEATSIKLNKTSVTLKKGGYVDLYATISPDNTSDKTIKWSSSNNKVAEVTNGRVKAVGKGTSKITVKTANNQTATCQIIVKEDEKIKATDIELDKTNIEIKVNEKAKITGKTIPSDATNQNISYVSNNKNIVTIDKDGNILGTGKGTAVITVSVDGIEKKCNVTVKENTIAVTKVEVSKTKISLYEGNIEKISTVISPSDASNKTLTYVSSDTNVAYVDNLGTVTAKKDGKATITVKSINGKTATVEVTVKKQTVEISSLEISPKTVTIEEGSSKTLGIVINPSNSSNRTVGWNSSNSNIVTVTNGVIKGISAGEATITATSNNGKTASCKVTVTKKAPKVVAVTSVSLNIQNKEIEINDSFALTGTVSPSNATDKTITWKSSDPSVAEVSKGTVKGLKAGTATIEAKSNNGKTATCTVTVNKKIAKYIDQSAKQPSSTAQDLYNSSTLKYWVEKNSSVDKNKYGFTSYQMFHIWVEDPYNQFKVKLSNGDSYLISHTYRNGGRSAYNIFNNYVKKSGKGFVGTNGSYYVEPSPSGAYCGHPWSYTPRTAVIFYNGSLLRNDTKVAKADYDKYESYNDIAGIGEDGNLKYYSVRNGQKNVNPIETIDNNIQKARNDKVKYTVASLPKLVNNGKVYATYQAGQESLDRMFICQIDGNNFIMGHTRAPHPGLANYLADVMKCQTAVSIDGGGSCNMYYKIGTSNSIQGIESVTVGRYIPDVVYFEEK